MNDLKFILKTWRDALTNATYCLDSAGTWVHQVGIILALWISTIFLPAMGIAIPAAASAPSMVPRFKVFYYPGLRFSLSTPGSPGLPQAAGPQGLDQISIRAFDTVNNALRINATLAPGGTHTPTDADQVFTSVFDSVNNAVRVNCVLGCGASVTFAGDLGGSPTSQTVIALQGHPVSTATPASNQVLAWISGAWTPQTPTTGAGAGNCAANQFVIAVNLGSAPNCLQATFGNLSGAATKSQQVTTTVYTDQANVFGAGNKATFTAGPGVAGFNLAPTAADPTAPAPGDLWTSGAQLKWRDNSGTPLTRVVVDTSRNINTSGALTGGGNLATDLTLSVASATVAAPGVLQLSGDLGGTAASPVVAKLQGNPVASTAPGSNQFLGWSGGQWQPVQPNLANLVGAVADSQVASAYSGIGNCAVAGTFVTALARNVAPTCTQPAFGNLSGQALPAQLPAATAAAQGAVQLSGDLGGTATAPLVAKLQGTPVASTAPSNGQCLTYTSSGSAWTPGSCASGSLGGAGTANLVPLWTAGTTQGNSSLSQSGNDITVGSGLASANLFIKGPTPFIDVTTYGAKADAQTTNGKVCSVKPGAPGLGTLVCTRGLFATTDVGKAIQIPESGASESAPLPVAASVEYTITNVAGVPSAGLYPQAVLSASIAQANGTGGTGASEQVSWGTDNSAAFQAAWNAAPCRGGAIFVPGGGDYLFGSTVQTGVPAPAAPSVTAGAGGAGTIGASLYVTTAYTYVNRCGETSAANVSTAQVGTGTNNFITFNGPAPAGVNNATSYNLYACTSATSGACSPLILQQSGLALNTLPSTLNTVATTGAAPPTANTTLPNGLVVRVQGGSAKWEGTAQSSARFETELPIAIFQFGQADGNTFGGFQLWNAAFRDASSNGSALGGVYAVNESEAIVAFDDFESFNGQQTPTATSLGLSYGIKWDTANGIYNNDDVMIHDKAKNNSVIVDASAPNQDGPLVIGGDYFPAIESSSWAPATCYGIINSGTLRISGGAHFDIDTGGDGVTGCVGVKVGVTNSGVYNGSVIATGIKMESAETAHKGIGYELGPSSFNAPNEIDTTFSNIGTVAEFDACQTSICPGPTRIVEYVASVPTGAVAPYITDNSLGNVAYSYELYKGSAGTFSQNAWSFAGSATIAPTNPGTVGLTVNSPGNTTVDVADFQAAGATKVSINKTGSVTAAGLNLTSTAYNVTRLAKLTAALTPVAVGANSCAEQRFTVNGVNLNDVILGVNKPTAQAGLAIAGVRSAGPNLVGINFCNVTAASITPTASETYLFAVMQ